MKTNLYHFGTKLQMMLLFIFSVLLSSCLSDELDEITVINENYTSIKSVQVEGAMLEVEYMGQAGSQGLNMQAELRSNTKSRYEINYRVSGEKLIVEVVSKKGLFGGAKAEGHIRFTGPRDMSLILAAGSGKIKAENVVSPETKLTIVSGEINAKGITSGRTFFTSTSGQVKAEDITGRVTADVSSGSMEISRVDGDLDANGSSGLIKLTGINGQVNATMSSGKVEMTNVKSIGKINVSSGQLFATTTGLSSQTELRASSGNIYVQTPTTLRSFNYNITVGSGSAKVGTSQSTSGALNINNGATSTIRGEVGSGKIEIVN
jgi:hypothetical protein